MEQKADQREAADIDDSKTATQSDIQRLIAIIRQRDQRILEAEAQIQQITESFSKLREDLLPCIRMVKNKSPLPPVSYSSASGTYDDVPETQVQEPPPPAPTPSLAPPSTGRGLSRKFSMKKLILGTTPKSSSSPTFTTHVENAPTTSYNDGYGTTPTAPTHPVITTTSSSQAPQIPPFSSFDPHPSPTSPATLSHHPAYDPHASIPAPSPMPQHSSRNNTNNGLNNLNNLSNNNISNPPPPSIRTTRTPAPPYHEDPPSDHDRPEPRQQRSRGESSSAGSGSNSVEIFKSFRVSMDDPCYKVLPAALKRYNIQADWRQYALYIVHGDQERCLGLEERPLILFKQLDKEGRKPMFMLRRNAGGAPGGPGPGGAGDMGGGGGGGMGMTVPGGVL